jgi:hypothetical protein
MSNFDDLLDDVLREETRTAPRSGMEQRILARVREERARGSYLPRMGWMVGASLAACLVVAIAVHPWQRGMHDAPLPSAQAVRIPSATASMRPQVEASDVSPTKDTSPRPRRRKVVSVRAATVRPAEMRDGRDPSPKLDTFPAVTQRSGPLMVSSPMMAEAIRELKTEQEQPLTVAEIEIKPL